MSYGSGDDDGGRYVEPSDRAVEGWRKIVLARDETIARLERELAEARAKAERFEADWVAAKYEFGEAMARMRDTARTAIALEDAALPYADWLAEQLPALAPALAASRAAREARKACPHGYDRLANCPACKP